MFVYLRWVCSRVYTFITSRLDYYNPLFASYHQQFFFFFSPSFFGSWVSTENQKFISGTQRSKLPLICSEIIVILGSDSNPN